MISRTIFFLIGLFIVSSCEYAWQVEYFMVNESSEPVKVLLSSSTQTDTIDLNLMEEVRIYFDSGIGPRPEDVMESIDSIEIGLKIEILTQSGEMNKNDLNVLQEWEVLFPDESETGTGVIRKAIVDSDFE